MRTIGLNEFSWLKKKKFRMWYLNVTVFFSYHL